MQNDTCKKEKVLVICSGGLDSVSMALRYIGKAEVLLMSFLYGQKAKKEVEVVRELAKKYADKGTKFQLCDISQLKAIFGDKNQLTNDVSVEDNYAESVVVPLRNALFLQVAIIYAYSHGFDKVVLGSHLDDCELIDGEYAFPDCTPDFFKAFEVAMDLGVFRRDKKVKIETASTLGLHKKDLIRFAAQMDEDILMKTWSCYKGNGDQCGKRDSCRNRKAAFKEAGIIDKTKYEA